MSHQFNFRISESLHALIKKQAEAENRSKTELITIAIEHYLKANGYIDNSRVSTLSNSKFEDCTFESDLNPFFPPLTEQPVSSSVNDILTNHLFLSLEAQFKEGISVLTKRISALESSIARLDASLYLDSRSGNPCQVMQQSQGDQPILIEKPISLSRLSAKNGNNISPANMGLGSSPQLAEPP